MTVVGRPDVKVADIVNPGDYFDGGGLLQWVDTTRDGAEEYVKGYVDYFRQLGAVFLRIDFLAWYEVGFDQSEGTVGVAHGRESYLQALEWMREAAGDMQLSLVMPNLFDHGSGRAPVRRPGPDRQRRQLRHLVRPERGPPDLAARVVAVEQPVPRVHRLLRHLRAGPDDPRRRPAAHAARSPTTASARRAINLFTMAGAPIAITDQVDTIGDNAHFFQNPEVLALRKAGLVGKPVFNNSHGFEYDPSSRDPERWIGQLPDGSWAVALFNREDGPGTTTKSIDFAAVLGFTGPAAVRDLWAHQDLGSMTSYQVALAPHASVLLSVVPHGPRPLSGRGRGLGRIGPVREHLRRPRRHGLRHRPRHRGEQCGRGHLGAQCRQSPSSCATSANSTGSPSTLTVRALDPATGDVHGTATPRVPSTPAWTSWRTVPVTLTMAAGTNLVVCSVGHSDQGGVNLDYLALA